MRAIDKILFVCLGNICRSPMAEGAMRRVVARRGLRLEMDSAGTGDWHIGKPPDSRAIAVARAHNVDISGQHARQIQRSDFVDWDLIVVMDAANLGDVLALAPAGTENKVRLFRDFVPGNENAELADPYFGEDEGFEIAWIQAIEAAEALADLLECEQEAADQSARKSTSGS